MVEWRRLWCVWWRWEWRMENHFRDDQQITKRRTSLSFCRGRPSMNTFHWAGTFISLSLSLAVARFLLNARLSPWCDLYTSPAHLPLFFSFARFQFSFIIYKQSHLLWNWGHWGAHSMKLMGSNIDNMCVFMCVCACLCVRGQNWGYRCVRWIWPTIMTMAGASESKWERG